MSTSFRDRIDAAAEAEAAALDLFADLTDTPAPVTRLQRARDEAVAAAALGLTAPTPVRYPRGAVLSAWLAALDAVKAGRVPTPREVRLPETHAELAARVARRTDRRCRLDALAALPPEREITLAEAAALSGVPESSLEKCRYKYRTLQPARRDGRRCFPRGSGLTYRAADVVAALSGLRRVVANTAAA